MEALFKPVFLETAERETSELFIMFVKTIASFCSLIVYLSAMI